MNTHTFICRPHSFQTLLESMMDAAESLCPHVMKRSSLRPELMKASSAKMVVPKSFVTKTLLEQSGVDIVNKIRWVCVEWYNVYVTLDYTGNPWHLSELVCFCCPALLPDHHVFLPLCQWGEAESRIFPVGSHCWRDSGSSLHLTTHSGKTTKRSSGALIHEQWLLICPLNFCVLCKSL